MYNHPDISICMVFYNAEPYIREAIDSALKQSFENFEFVIVDDGSTDGSRDIVKSYTDTRIKYFKNKHDYIDSLNKAYSSATGKYNVKMDSDDKMHEDRLLVLFNFMEGNPDIAACGTGFERFGASTDRYIPPVIESDEIEQALSNDNCFAFPIIRRSFLVDNNITFKEGYISAEDYRMWADIVIAGGKLANLRQVLYYYRIHNKQITSTRYEHTTRILEEIKGSIRDYLQSKRPDKPRVVNINLNKLESL